MRILKFVFDLVRLVFFVLLSGGLYAVMVYRVRKMEERKIRKEYERRVKDLEKKRKDAVKRYRERVGKIGNMEAGEVANRLNEILKKRRRGK